LLSARFPGTALFRDLHRQLVLAPLEAGETEAALHSDLILLRDRGEAQADALPVGAALDGVSSMEVI
jgi:hypothetical protein